MIILSATNQSLEMDLEATVASTQLDYIVSYVDVTTTTYAPAGSDGTSNNTTAVTIVSAPGDASTQRQIKQITIYNADSASAVVTIQKVNGANTRILCKVLLETTDTLQYNDGEGFSVVKATGTAVSSSTTIGISAGTQSISGPNMVVLSNSNNISFGMSGSSQVTASYLGPTASFWEFPFGWYVNNTYQTTTATGNVYFYRFYIPFYMTATRMDALGSLSVAGSTAGSWSIYGAIYTRSGDAISMASSGIGSSTWNSGGATNQYNSYHGVSGTRWRSMQVSMAFTPGEYWFAFSNSVSGVAGTTGSVGFSGMTGIALSALPGGGLGLNNNGNETRFWGVNGFYPILYASSTLPEIVNYDEIIWCNSAANASVFRVPYIRFFGSH